MLNLLYLQTTPPYLRVPLAGLFMSRLPMLNGFVEKHLNVYLFMICYEQPHYIQSAINWWSRFKIGDITGKSYEECLGCSLKMQTLRRMWFVEEPWRLSPFSTRRSRLRLSSETLNWHTGQTSPLALLSLLLSLGIPQQAHGAWGVVWSISDFSTPAIKGNSIL